MRRGSFFSALLASMGYSPGPRRTLEIKFNPDLDRIVSANLADRRNRMKFPSKKERARMKSRTS
jgi:hypothetical protein